MAVPTPPHGGPAGILKFILHSPVSQSTCLLSHNTMPLPGFGFSVGDFIAAVQPSLRLFETVRDTTDVPSQYQQAVVKLQSLLSVLRRLQSLEPTSTDRELIHQVQLLSHACSIPVSTFITKIREFDRYLGLHPQSSSSSFAEKLASGRQRIE